MNISFIINRFLVFIMSFFVFNSALAVSMDKEEEKQLPALFSAILNEDVKLYSKEMEKLLNKPMKDFVKVIQFKTKEGDTIFHLMAGVRSRQAFFAKEMGSLIDVFYPGSFDSSLGNVKISIPYVEDTELFPFIEKLDLSAILQYLNRLGKEGTAIEWIQNIQARSEDNSQSVRGLIEDLIETRKGFFGDNIIDGNSHNKQVKKIIEKIKYIPVSEILLSEKNHKKLLPQDIAYKSVNLPAYNTIKQSSAKKESLESLQDIGMVTGGMLGFGLFFYDLTMTKYLPVEELLPFMIAFVGMPAIGAAIGAIAPSACYEVFQKVKKNKLEKKNQSLKKEPASPSKLVN